MAYSCVRTLMLSLNGSGPVGKGNLRELRPGDHEAVVGEGLIRSDSQRGWGHSELPHQAGEHRHGTMVTRLPRLLTANTTAFGRETRRASSDPACFPHSGQCFGRPSENG